MTIAACRRSCVAYYNYMIRLLDTKRTIIVLTNCGPIVPATEAKRGDLISPRARAHQVNADSPSISRPMMSLWICVVPSGIVCICASR